jgi:urea transport system permease protein
MRVVYLVLSYIIWSPVGTVLAAIRDNDQRTAFFGYNIVSYKVGAFVVSALVSGLCRRAAVRFRRSIIDRLRSIDRGSHLGGGGRTQRAPRGIPRRAARPFSDRLGDYWLFALGMLFVLTVVLMPTGLFGRILMPPLPKRLRGRLDRVGDLTTTVPDEMTSASTWPHS